MDGTLTPDLEFTWVPTLLAAGAVVVGGLVGNLVFFQPGLLGWGVVFGGILASAASGYYHPSGNNGALGTLLGFLIVTPIVAFTRAAFFSQTTGDTAYATFAFASGYLIIGAMAFIPLAYIVATLTDMTRKKVGGRIGYGEDRPHNG